MEIVHAGNALTNIGRELISELNRLGGEFRSIVSSFVNLISLVLVDLAHTSDETMREVEFSSSTLSKKS